MANTPFADLYKWVKTHTKQETIDGMALNSEKIDTKLSEHATRLSDIALNVKSFGAKGDWNGTTGTNNLQFFNNAVDALSITGGTIYIPNGDYWFSDAWIISKSNVTVVISPNAILRTTTQTVFGGLLTFKGLGSDTTPTMKNGRVTGGGTIITPAALDNAIGFVRCDGCYVDDVTVSAGHKGVTTQQYNANIHFQNIRVIEANTAGIALEDGVTNAVVNNIKVDKAGKAVLVTGGSARAKNITISTVVTDQTTGDGVHVSQADTVNLSGFQLSNVGGRGLAVDNSSLITVDGLKIKDAKRQGLSFAIITGTFKVNKVIMENVANETPNTYNAIELNDVPIPFQILNSTLIGITHKNTVVIGTSLGNQGEFEGNSFDKGQSDTDFNYSGNKPIKVDDMLGGKHYRLKDGVREFRGISIPVGLNALVGDTVYNTTPTATKNISHWVCRVAGSPGTWTAFGTGQGTTVQRPSDLTVTDYNYMYFDTDLKRVIAWNGFGWVV